jgi:hypothetical protein
VLKGKGCFRVRLPSRRYHSINIITHTTSRKCGILLNYVRYLDLSGINQAIAICLFEGWLSMRLLCVRIQIYKDRKERRQAEIVACSRDDANDKTRAVTRHAVCQRIPCHAAQHSQE